MHLVTPERVCLSGGVGSTVCPLLFISQGLPVTALLVTSPYHFNSFRVTCRECSYVKLLHLPPSLVILTHHHGACISMVTQKSSLVAKNLGPGVRLPGFNPNSVPYKLCDLGHVTAPLCTSTFPSVKWEIIICLPH